MSWQRTKAAQSIDPARVENALSAIADNWPLDAPPLQRLIEEFPLGETALLHLLSVSSICATRLIRQPHLLLWLAQPDVCASIRGYGEMLTQLRDDATDGVAVNNFRALRLWKGREMTRIALREIAGVATLAQTTAELSQVAEICLGEVYRYWNGELRQRLGAPEAAFTIIGLGKLGGRELNHSSDVDVIFAYSEEGQLGPNVTYHQWFNMLAEKITGTFSAAHDAGALFRIDLRLRPEGTAGPLARSLESMENYYSGFGETWERLALVKARGVAGDRELAYEFLRQHQPFIFPKSPTRDLLDEIAAIKRRIERDVVGHEKLARNVKLGAGGIREIEFVVQALQLLHGARHAFLQETSTLRALPVLADLELLPRNEARQLLDAYEFLRSVEHRLQIEAEQQTHTVPDDPVAVGRLARSLQLKSAGEFIDQLHAQMREVRAIFHRVISEPQTAGEAGEEKSLPAFRDPTSAQKSLAELGRSRSGFHVAPRTRQVFERLQPLLLEELRDTADPDTTLNQLIRFVDAYGLRSMLFELLVAHPRLLELLVKTFDASRYAGDLLIRRPQLLEEITRGDMLDRQFSVASHLKRLRALGVTPASLDRVRVYRHTQGLRILLRDILGIADLSTILAEQSDLAEACLIFVDELRGSIADLTIVALGKFGGSEIGYGADLDILFVGENATRAAQHLMVAMAQPTSEGAIYTLDPRLRPDGETGPLSLPLDGYALYYETRAQLWEIQALTRARPVVGPDCERFLAMAQQIWRRAGERSDLMAQISAMFQRIRRDRSGMSDELDFKTGTGGMIAAEFVVQALQMRFGIWEQNTERAVGLLLADDRIAPEAADGLMQSYNYLRRIAGAVRRYEKKGLSHLPNDELGQRHVAYWVGAKDLDDFAQRYRNARRAIDEIFKRYVG
ncbi:MAG: bifunctional [glutamate--ammonia ligase]-adenylyl-L-tyrosine phosphorylase/[glutamate--ammonia-ligase] adenylyltransferase [Chthoniobacterales bacterium]